MTKTFTENDIVRFLYDEVNEDERIDFNESLRLDSQLQDKVRELSKLINALDDFTMKTPSDVVSRILYASKNLQSA